MPPFFMSALGASPRAYPQLGKVLKAFDPVLKPIAKYYPSLSGWRRDGLLLDDLIVEENDTVEKAIKRLPKQESYDRVYRLKRAILLDAQHKPLPADKHTPSSGVNERYLTPMILHIENEQNERAFWDTHAVTRDAIVGKK